MCRHMITGAETPATMASVTKSRSLMLSTSPRACRANLAHTVAATATITFPMPAPPAMATMIRRQQHRGKPQNGINQPHHARCRRTTAEVAGHNADGGPDYGTRSQCNQAYEHRGARSVDESAQDVFARFVRAQQEFGGLEGRDFPVPLVQKFGVVGRDQRREYRRDYEHHEDQRWESTATVTPEIFCQMRAASRLAGAMGLPGLAWPKLKSPKTADARVRPSRTECAGQRKRRRCLRRLTSGYRGSRR